MRKRLYRRHFQFANWLQISCNQLFHRLSSAPIPFTVLSILSNPVNQDHLAVAGLKDCHVLTFNSSGTVSEHLVLHPQLDANNFIVKTLWMPGMDS